MAADDSEPTADFSTFIEGLQSTLDKFRSSRKDDEEEKDPGPEPKNLKQAADKAYGLMRASRRKTQDQQERQEPPARTPPRGTAIGSQPPK